MSDDLVKRLRDWEHVWPEDYNKPEGSLYISAADRIEELEAKLAKAVEFAEIVKRTGHGELEFIAVDMIAKLKGEK